MSTSTSLDSLGARLADMLDESVAGARDVAGAVVGVAVGDAQMCIARGSANLNTDQPFTEDTGWLLGSVTKVLTTTVLLRLVERGGVDLDAAVSRYVPDLALREPGLAEQITVRMLLNHTNGIDADTLVPSPVRGRDAGRSFVQHLRNVGVLFEPGTCIHYTNPGFVLAARIIEEQTGLPFERAIQSELFDPCGMDDATAVQTQALLRRTAVGALYDPGTDQLRATPLFTVPESIGGAGSTPIVTVADMLAFGRMHLRAGLAGNGTRVLSAEWARAMLTPTFALGLPQAPPIGLGWWLLPIAETTVAAHGGNSPGGLSSFAILPDHDAVIVSFATGPGNRHLNDRLHIAAVEQLTGRKVTAPFEPAPVAPDPGVVGEYGAFQVRTAVDSDGESLLVTHRFEPYDDDHRATMAAFGVLSGALPTVPYSSVAPGLYAPAGADPASLAGLYGRMSLLATLPATDGRRAGLHTELRYTPRLGD